MVLRMGETLTRQATEQIPEPSPARATSGSPYDGCGIPSSFVGLVCQLLLKYVPAILYIGAFMTPMPGVLRCIPAAAYVSRSKLSFH